MPVAEHPSFISPPETDRLWRYMEFAKFAALLTSGGLWFCHARTLAKEDPFEGTLPKPLVRQWRREDFPENYFDNFGRGDEASREEAIRNFIIGQNHLAEMAIQIRDTLFVSCWHSAPHETAAMWKSYGKHEGAIAITTDLQRLRRALENAAAPPIYCGKIQYIDFETDSILLDNLFNPILRKRNSFGTENEVRLVFAEPQLHGMAKADLPSGQLVICPMAELIDEVWVSPTAPPYLVEVVSELCRLTGFSGKLRRSTLLDAPPIMPPGHNR